MGFWDFIGIASSKDCQNIESSLNKMTELLEKSLEQGSDIKKSMALFEDRFNENLKNVENKLNEKFNTINEESKKNVNNTEQIIVSVSNSLSEELLNELNNQSVKIVDYYEQIKSLGDSTKKLEKIISDTNIHATKELKLAINDTNKEIVEQNKILCGLEQQSEKTNHGFKEGIFDINFKSDDIKKAILEAIESTVSKNQELLIKNTKIIAKEISENMKDISTQNKKINDNFKDGIIDINFKSEDIKRAILEAIENTVSKNQKLLIKNSELISKEIFEHINCISTQNIANSEKLVNLDVLNNDIYEVMKMNLVNNVIEELKIVNSRGM